MLLSFIIKVKLSKKLRKIMKIWIRFRTMIKTLMELIEFIKPPNACTVLGITFDSVTLGSFDLKE